jgi:hypothetical protein
MKAEFPLRFLKRFHHPLQGIHRFGKTADSNITTAEEREIISFKITTGSIKRAASIQLTAL